MTWEDRIQAMQSLGELTLRMRKPGDWYVNHSGVERAEGCLLCGGCVTGAKTPQEATEQHWKWLTELKGDQYIVTNAMNDRRMAYRWTGYMWKRWEEAA